METWYDKEEDILNIELNTGESWKSIELAEGIVIDVTKEGKIVSFEIPHASKFFTGDVKKVIEKAKIVVNH
ncbi:hypothetical protein COV18_00075 [Candidatus Woesearchaeota archaeon CG10_big_fil_rev_8_21_14_0_10_37_12]|nr:MAG: hypothetical protein COV18_00075 [Candidatus Woesearchaeota archaeon CG10_big_fil_rev_8_21_14_0_10_37_12]